MCRAVIKGGELWMEMQIPTSEQSQELPTEVRAAYLPKSRVKSQEPRVESRVKSQEPRPRADPLTDIHLRRNLAPRSPPFVGIRITYHRNDLLRREVHRGGSGPGLAVDDVTRADVCLGDGKADEA